MKVLCSQTDCGYEKDGCCSARCIHLFPMQKNYPRETECQTFKVFLKPTTKWRNKEIDYD